MYYVPFPPLSVPFPATLLPNPDRPVQAYFGMRSPGDRARRRGAERGGAGRRGAAWGGAEQGQAPVQCSVSSELLGPVLYGIAAAFKTISDPVAEQTPPPPPLHSFHAPAREGGGGRSASQEKIHMI